ncbi:hypothetical protein ACRRTK_008350 [Alexandromys fortis]
MCIDVSPTCMTVQGVRSPGTGVTDSCEMPFGYWVLSPGPLEEHPVLLTTEPSLQFPGSYFELLIVLL